MSDLSIFHIIAIAVAIYASVLCLLALTRRALFHAFLRTVFDACVGIFAGIFTLLVSAGCFGLILGEHHPLVLICLITFPAVTCMVAVFAARPSKHAFSNADAEA
ncbi:hypothetical protein ASG87_01560 [Frateuria sp. Soil773]|uniref:hypothetical protein n=1 Tax=Frateuria sp. Soil773 TaxID=1736407 RepID=UPI0006FA2F95|nr:hypothetical protein [Frateuria sp. Soil773]KRE90851.1 hypothetical protein ASG87_01560 [Frateuria sp. Soil773]